MQANMAGVHCDEFYLVPCLRYCYGFFPCQTMTLAHFCSRRHQLLHAKNEMKARAWILGSLANYYAFDKEE